MYHSAKEYDNIKESIQRGNFFALFTTPARLKRYLRCIFIALPTWYMIRILVQRTASHFGPAMIFKEPYFRAEQYHYLI